MKEFMDIERVPTRDKQVVVLASVFFLGKYIRRNVTSEGFKRIYPEVDLSDPVSILRAGFELRKQENSDIDGDVVEAVSSIVSKHPRRQELFGDLTDIEVSNICRKLDYIFVDQEFSANCESWSFYDAKPEDFAIGVTTDMLSFIGHQIGMGWFEDIDSYSGQDRREIVEAILKEGLPINSGGLLLFGVD